ncbi:hypothetical protein K8R32_03770 [bacterium]|nr:hypothetical protein [bacterium]
MVELVYYINSVNRSEINQIILTLVSHGENLKKEFFKKKRKCTLYPLIESDPVIYIALTNKQTMMFGFRFPGDSEVNMSKPLNTFREMLAMLDQGKTEKILSTLNSHQKKFI